MAKNSKKLDSLIHKSFQFGMIAKGVDGVLEIVGGIILSAIGPQKVIQTLMWFLQLELSKDPNDPLANGLLHFAHSFVADKFFAISFLISHGIIKIFLVTSLIKQKLWAYPIAILVFVAFIIYQSYIYLLDPTVGLFVITILDVLIIFLTWAEYSNQKSKIKSTKSIILN